MTTQQKLQSLNLKDLERDAWLNAVRYVLRRRLSSALTGEVMTAVHAAEAKRTLPKPPATEAGRNGLK